MKGKEVLQDVYISKVYTADFKQNHKEGKLKHVIWVEFFPLNLLSSKFL